MMSLTKVNHWDQQAYSFELRNLNSQQIRNIYNKVFRVNCLQPGFSLIDCGTEINSYQFRNLIVQLIDNLRSIYQENSGKQLNYFSLGRFDQQETTKLHRDGGPEESILILGYEPSEIISEISISDYSNCAVDSGLTPEVILRDYNPMFNKGYDLLKPYITTLEAFNNKNFQILLINNSQSNPEIFCNQLAGVLHGATILQADFSKERVINSIMLESTHSSSSINADDILNFINTSEIKRKIYYQE